MSSAIEVEVEDVVREATEILQSAPVQVHSTISQPSALVVKRQGGFFSRLATLWSRRRSRCHVVPTTYAHPGSARYEMPIDILARNHPLLLIKSLSG